MQVIILQKRTDDDATDDDTYEGLMKSSFGPMMMAEVVMLISVCGYFFDVVKNRWGERMLDVPIEHLEETMQNLRSVETIKANDGRHTLTSLKVVESAFVNRGTCMINPAEFKVDIEVLEEYEKFINKRKR